MRNHSKLARNADKFVLSGMELTTAHTGVSGSGGGRRGMDPPGSGPEEVGMERSPAGFGRRRKKEQLYRVGKGMNKVGSAGGFCRDAGMENRRVLLQAMEKLAHEKYFVARTFQRPSPWIWLSFVISLTTSPIGPFSSYSQTLHSFSDDLLASVFLNSYWRCILNTPHPHRPDTWDEQDAKRHMNVVLISNILSHCPCLLISP